MMEVERSVGSSLLFRMVSFEPQVDKKMVIVGDAGCGKSELIRRYVNGTFSSDYQPTVHNNQLAEVDVGVTWVALALWDTAGRVQYDQLRSLSYPDQDVVMICFNIADPASLESVESQWLPEVRHHCPGVPVMLVGLQKDCRKDGKAVTSRQANHLAEKMGAHTYLECSAKFGKGVDEVFLAAARIALLQRKRRP